MVENINKPYQINYHLFTKDKMIILNSTRQQWYEDHEVPKVGDMLDVGPFIEVILDVKRNYTIEELRLMKLKRIIEDE